MGRHVVRQLLLPLRLQHQRAPAADYTALRERLWPFLGGIAREHQMKAMAVGGVANHVHILLMTFVALLKRHNIAYDERYL